MCGTCNRGIAQAWLLCVCVMAMCAHLHMIVCQLGQPSSAQRARKMPKYLRSSFPTWEGNIGAGELWEGMWQCMRVCARSEGRGGGILGQPAQRSRHLATFSKYNGSDSKDKTAAGGHYEAHSELIVQIDSL